MSPIFSLTVARILRHILHGHGRRERLLAYAIHIRFHTPGSKTRSPKHPAFHERGIIYNLFRRCVCVRGRERARLFRTSLANEDGRAIRGRLGKNKKRERKKKTQKRRILNSSISYRYRDTTRDERSAGSAGERDSQPRIKSENVRSAGEREFDRRRS